MSLTVLILALLLDAVMGEPRAIWSRLPHPAVLMGRAVGWCDRRLNGGAHPRLAGVGAMALLAAGALLLGLLLEGLGDLVALLVAAVLLAHRSLVDHVRAVARGLRSSLPEGRRAVAMIVGRDTAAMTEPAVARAAIESAAENFSDAVIAPAFWFAVAGLPGLLLYKVTNTADSMIGHRTPRHAAFGWAAARLDDLLNLVPARLSALLIAVAHGQTAHWRAIRADARRHRSPNAGWPEAAMARALGVALSGPRSYAGRMTDDPFVNPEGRRPLAARDIDDCIRALWRAWWLFLACLAVIAVVLG
ncbi:adenosylcobinamide-phosphate synthase CbiB [Roseovarius sp. SCSIO 43702]|uniref:adenosylcobinamide-phosphate synthase CbiB n=1 Tax=Roseovarius sp. SCSIO 43702 TaxID=2823043 RepID=UPI001C7317B2|nr:adenosylcobinamide-phosphate synthase CbiB [Roseovarius sp. SCSIO 43702]QYX55797.1 adenosylcobinamide-phosphate synthase CbiB [Roseovarius sp. SCSIO 43702]